MKEVAEKYKQFVKYYDSHLKPRISSLVTEANKRINTKKLWTTNNAESMNRVMKVSQLEATIDPEVIQHGRLSVYKSPAVHYIQPVNTN